MRVVCKPAILFLACAAILCGVRAISAPPPDPTPDQSVVGAPAVQHADDSASPAPAVAAATDSSREAQWIWSPAAASQSSSTSPIGTCFFRRSFDMNQPEAGEVQITADESYELYVNGRKAGEGHNWHVMGVHDITQYLRAGRNTVAVLAAKTDSGPAGLAARVLVKSSGDTWVRYLTDAAWKTSQKEFVGWTQSRFSELQWVPAREIGQFGVVKPWLDEMHLAHGLGNRFQISEEFSVQPVVSPKATGSLIAMAFNEFGDILASREGGPLLIIHSAKAGAAPSKVSIYCDEVKNIQGILPLNGRVFVVGAGPQGTGLYRISEAGTPPILAPSGDAQSNAAGPDSRSPRTLAAPSPLRLTRTPAAANPRATRRTRPILPSGGIFLRKIFKPCVAIQTLRSHPLRP